MVPSEKIRLIVAGSGGMHYINIKFFPTAAKRGEARASPRSSA